jgi:hypothetical protein
MNEKPKRSFGGGKRREPERGERCMIGTRVTPAVKKRIEEAAAASGRSQAQEIEFRLEKSFMQEDAFADLRRVVTEAMAITGKRRKRWLVK